MKTTHTLIALIIFCLCSNVKVNAGVNPDLSFGTDGNVITDLFGHDDVVYDMATQSDGKIVVTGYSIVQSHREFMVIRYLPTGIIDSTFGDNGKATVDVGVANSTARALAIQSDDKIVVAGYYDNNFYNDAAVTRFNADGSVDSTFGNAGVVKMVLSNQFDEFQDVIVQSDDNIVLTGKTTQNGTEDFLLIRLQPDGSPDPFFGINGQVTTDFGGNNDCIHSLIIQPDRKIVVSGSSSIGSSYFVVARYLTDGTLDPSFGTLGKLQVLSGNRLDNCYGMTLQNDTSIVMVGTHHSGSIDNYMVVRLTRNGALDNSFGLNGVVLLQASLQTDQLNDVVITKEGNILIAGSSSGVSSMLLQLTSSGNPDPDFGISGFFQIGNTGTQSALNTLIVLEDSSVVAAGFNNNGTDFDFLLTKAVIRSTTGVEENAGYDLGVEIFPNPVINDFIIELPESNGRPIAISIFNEEGKLFLEKKIMEATEKLNMTLPGEIATGVYFVRVIRGTGKSVKRIVIQ